MEPTSPPSRPAARPAVAGARPGPWDEVVARFRAGTLCRSEWTHEAHLAVCLAALDEHGDVDATTAALCHRITTYNAACGLPAGRVTCHVTITTYFVEAVARSGVHDVDGLASHPWCDRRAPLRHWTRAALDSEAARSGWLAPDAAALPWVDV